MLVIFLISITDSGFRFLIMDRYMSDKAEYYVRECGEKYMGKFPDR